MTLKPMIKPFSALGIKITLRVAIAYWFFLSFTKVTMEFIPGLEFRFATFVPFVCGILYGLPGALGAALGNILGDLGDGNYGAINLGSAILNFYLAYLPHKLWFSYRCHAATQHVFDQKSFAKFVSILLVVTFNFAVYLSALIDVFYATPVPVAPRYFIFFSNNFVYPLLMGLPLLFYLKSKDNVWYYEPRVKGNSYGGKQIVALCLLTIIGAVYMCVSFYVDIANSIAAAVYLVGVILMGYVATIPSRFVPESTDKKNFVSIVAKATANILFFVSVIIIGVAIVVMCMHDKSASLFNDTKNWEIFYFRLLLVFDAVFLAIYIFLGKLRNNVAKPLGKLSKYAMGYVATGRIREESLKGVSFVQHPRNEIEVLESSYARLSRDIVQYLKNLTKAAEEKYALEAQLGAASKIQQGILPDLATLNASVREQGYSYTIKGATIATEQVGGDMYNCLRLDDDHLLLVVGDVAGTGMPASLISMELHALIANSVQDADEMIVHLDSEMSAINDVIAGYNPEGMHVALWIGVLELSTGKLTYVNAGHISPYMVDNSDALSAACLAGSSGPVLGVLSGIKYTIHQGTLSPNGRLIVYTNGMVDITDEKGECYGTKRLLVSFLQCNRPEDIVADIKNFAGGAIHGDDVTYLWVERTQKALSVKS